ncbi:hypothetical protein WOLCODRAFT_62157 [Wolfiporia cocos MD-104 SS10]|uniref:Ribosomal protein L10 n=1 Tax=Wolfiporia cocos (strain MD-104) TaxID=742152 RepID=A0A2H3JC78_WOLCO|nr:hypothetical protein WOLCODRAFT_62157 [Wolfiporia cocos MD-104 SS10]
MFARSPRIVCPPPALRHVRTYVVTVDPPRVYPNKSVPRVYSERKTFLYHQYTRMFQASLNSPLIFLQHSDFSVQKFVQLRREIAVAAARYAGTPTLSGLSPQPLPDPPKLMIMRTALFGVALRDFSPLDRQTVKDIADLVEGGLAVLSFPSLDPPQMNAILRAIQRTVPPRPPKTPQRLEQERKEREAAFVPGRRQKRVKTPKEPHLKLMGALIEGRVFKAPGVLDVAKLPTLDTLRAQLIGLLSAPAMQLSMVLNEASGARLARTLEGLKKSLEEEPRSQDGQPSAEKS